MIITVLAKPNQKKPLVTEIDTKALEVKIDAPPIKGLANKRLGEILADYYQTSPSKIKIIKGQFSRNKTIEIL